jgi:flagellar hook-basal body complex protein FliE
MRIEALIPDVAASENDGQTVTSNAFEKTADDFGKALYRAQAAEDAFASGSGDLQTAIYERARADVALSVATAACQRAAQSLQSILNMQV